MQKWALAALGLLVLSADLLADWQFFAQPGNRGWALLLSAAVRNLITLLAVAALFGRHRYAGYLLLAAAVLGLWRRSSYLLPLLAAPSGVLDWTLYTAGLDTAFRILLVGFAAGFLVARKGQE
jgi:hypothetical protein